jgi:hypothetical protein
MMVIIPREQQLMSDSATGSSGHMNSAYDSKEHSDAHTLRKSVTRPSSKSQLQFEVCYCVHAVRSV